MTEEAKMLSVQGILIALVDRCCKLNPHLDREELLSEGQLVALQAVRSHKPGRAQLTSWVHICFWRYLSGWSKSPGWNRRFASKYDVELVEDQPQRQRFSLESLLVDLSEEAGRVVRLVVEEGVKATELRKIVGPDFAMICKEIREALQ